MNENTLILKQLSNDETFTAKQIADAFTLLLLESLEKNTELLPKLAHILNDTTSGENTEDKRIIKLNEIKDLIIANLDEAKLSSVQKLSLVKALVECQTLNVLGRGSPTDFFSLYTKYLLKNLDFQALRQVMKKWIKENYKKELENKLSDLQDLITTLFTKLQEKTPDTLFLFKMLKIMDSWLTTKEESKESHPEEFEFLEEFNAKAFLARWFTKQFIYSLTDHFLAEMKEHKHYNHYSIFSARIIHLIDENTNDLSLLNIESPDKVAMHAGKTIARSSKVMKQIASIQKNIQFHITINNCFETYINLEESVFTNPDELPSTPSPQFAALLKKLQDDPSLQPLKQKILAAFPSKSTSSTNNFSTIPVTDFFSHPPQPSSPDIKPDKRISKLIEDFESFGKGSSTANTNSQSSSSQDTKPPAETPVSKIIDSFEFLGKRNTPSKY